MDHTSSIGHSFVPITLSISPTWTSNSLKTQKKGKTSFTFRLNNFKHTIQSFKMSSNVRIKELIPKNCLIEVKKIESSPFRSLDSKKNPLIQQ